MTAFTKHFRSSSPQDICREVQLQKRAAEAGISPVVYKTDGKKYIRMQHVEEMCIADKYGERMGALPIWIREQIVEILWTLYMDCKIQYIDVTPYNFIEKDGKVWVIDFGHAHEETDVIDPYLERIFNTWRLHRWNSLFK